MPPKAITPIEAAYKTAEKFADAIALKHGMDLVHSTEIHSGIKNILVELHNHVVEDMKNDMLTDITKALLRKGYKRPDYESIDV